MSDQTITSAELAGPRSDVIAWATRLLGERASSVTITAGAATQFGQRRPQDAAAIRRNSDGATVYLLDLSAGADPYAQILDGATGVPNGRTLGLEKVTGYNRAVATWLREWAAQ